MTEYRVSYTEQENGYCFTGEWMDEIVEAESEEEAIELIKQYFIDQTQDENEAEKYIYKACKIEK